MTRIVAIFALTIGLPALGGIAMASQSPHPANAAQHVAAPVFPPSLVGRWTAPPDRVPLSDDNAWGRNATAVRLAEMRINPDGTGSITVTRSVVNRAGAAFPGSRILERADFAIGSEDRPLGLRPRYTTTITSTSRRYPDPPVVESSIDGLRIEVFPPDEAPDRLEIDFRVFSGDGSFSATLRRQRTTGPAQRD